MDDLLFIILTLIVTVIGALGQINKKKRSARQQNQAEGNEPEEKPDNFWDFLNEEAYSQTEQQEEHLPEEEMIEQEDPLARKMDKPEPEPKITKPEYRFTAKNEGQSIYSSEITDKADEEKRKTKKKIRDFSLRKAVIYSEILNRKYE
jgi:cell division protein FtsN